MIRGSFRDEGRLDLVLVTRPRLDGLFDLCPNQRNHRLDLSSAWLSNEHAISFRVEPQITTHDTNNACTSPEALSFVFVERRRVVLWSDFT